MASERPQLITEPLPAVARELIRDALALQRLSASHTTEYYLVNLLAAFLRAEPDSLHRAFGPELIESASLEPAQRYAKLKDLADTILFLSGIFIDHIESGPVSTEYFFEIGSSAYLHLGALDRLDRAGGSFADTYIDLGTRFEAFVRVLGTISDQRMFVSDRHVLRLYQRWMQSSGQRDFRRLIALGLSPVHDKSRKPH